MFVSNAGPLYLYAQKADVGPNWQQNEEIDLLSAFVAFLAKGFKIFNFVVSSDAVSDGAVVGVSSDGFQTCITRG